MTDDRDFKRLVRARMEKTGEAYTTARAHLLARSGSLSRVDDTHAPPLPGTGTPEPSPATGSIPPGNGPPPGDLSTTSAPPPSAGGASGDPSPAPASPSGLPPGHETLAGMAEGTLVAATGHGWDHWVRLLDGAGGRTLPHAAIARHLQEVVGVDPWWAQTITVGYERLAGLRAPGQQRDGSWQVGRSRTFPVPVERLFQAFHDEGERGRWLGGEPTLRSARPGKVVRLVWPDGSVAEVGFAAKGDARSTASVEHRKLPDGNAAQARKAAWGEALDRLGDWLAEGDAGG